jgi:Uma2 family endonuclease
MGSVARVTSAAEGLPRRRFTVAEVEAMVAAGVMEEDERVELIGGELVPMSPKGNQHEVVKSALIDLWIRSRPDDCRVTQETTFRLSEDTYLEPDVVIYLRTTGRRFLAPLRHRP